MALYTGNVFESAADSIRSEAYERMEAARAGMEGQPMITFEVHTAFFSDINGHPGDVKRMPVRSYQALLATVQPDDPTGTPRYWRVLTQAAASPEAVADPAEAVAPASQELPGSPPITNMEEEPTPPAPPAKASTRKR